ncbi:Copper chaperone CopZ (CopZ) (PDB:1AFI) [Commensalibacter communis]|uniref:heavy-metal-associated domain-containing protein n=1 Tax=Commensalibacter communis TaxID=2972786 RepID=UPI0022FF6B18|nr:cation transporter [Commensalibacter communis]CAI3943561.1 Copper chaperone CopZ (CopZ) (PDB:1AFI) [Commensalibacter communis]CAI3944868.1 Copper chaperone CopZ (CopZ) (PDB:1AFI) [Commensalibacter communis]
MQTYKVEGMTCQHCAKAVKEAVEALSNVDEAIVNLEAKTVTIKGNPDHAALKAAIEEEGYELI